MELDEMAFILYNKPFRIGVNLLILINLTGVIITRMIIVGTVLSTIFRGKAELIDLLHSFIY